MNRIAARFANSQITVWRPTRGEDLRETWVRVGNFPASWSTKPKMMRDDNGTEFVPEARYFPALVIDVQRDDLIARGNIADATPDLNAYRERVRTTRENDESHFGRANSFMFATG